MVRRIFTNDSYPDWIGKIEKKFRWRHLRFEYGNWCYITNYCGETIAYWWVWENE